MRMRSSAVLVVALGGCAVLAAACQGNIGSGFPTIPQQGLTPNPGYFRATPAPPAPAVRSQTADLVLSATQTSVRAATTDGFGFELGLVPPTPAPSSSPSAHPSGSPGAGATPRSSATPTPVPTPSPTPSATPTPAPSSATAAAPAGSASPTGARATPGAPIHLSVALTAHPRSVALPAGDDAKPPPVALASVDLTPHADLTLYGLGALRFDAPKNELTTGRKFTIAVLQPGRRHHVDTIAVDTGLTAEGTTIASQAVKPLTLHGGETYLVVLYGDPVVPTPAPSAPASGAPNAANSGPVPALAPTSSPTVPTSNATATVAPLPSRT
ncbi:MAG: hypothetical protein ACREM8_05730 [Vulcanimicrobiaceae bacterium]